MTIGKNCVIRSGARVRESIILDGADIGVSLLHCAISRRISSNLSSFLDRQPRLTHHPDQSCLSIMLIRNLTFFSNFTSCLQKLYLKSRSIFQRSTTEYKKLSQKAE